MGLYRYDYINDKKSVISLKLCFSDRKSIEITDSDYRNKYDEGKGALMQAFLKKIINEFDFTVQGKSKIRAFQNLGAYWFSKNRNNKIN